MLTGYGRAALELAQTLLRVPGVELDISASVTPGAPSMKLPDNVIACIGADREMPVPDVVIVHTLPLDCAEVMRRVVIELRNRADGPGLDGPLPKFVAYTTWETLAPPPEVIAALFNFDQVWVPSHANYLALSYDTLENKLRIVPHAFDASRWTPGEKLIEQPAWDASLVKPPPPPRPYRFYYVGAWNARKNPAGVIRAYFHAFTKADPVELTLHLGPTDPHQIALAVGSCGVDSSNQPAIRVGLKHISDDMMRELHESNDCFVTASRGEGWNLGAFEALLAGNHVIAPRGHGSDDFLSNTTAELYNSVAAPALVDAKLLSRDGGAFSVEVRAPQGVNAKGVWLEPDTLQLAHKMRHAFDRRTRGIRGPDPRAMFGYDAVATLIVHPILKELTK